MEVWATDALLAAGVGFVAGVLSGAFGIGGGIVTTPAIRLLLGAPALIAVGTPLPVIIPGALTGALSYRRRGLADVRAGIVIGLAGAGTAVAGAFATRLVGGPAVLTGTALIILWAAADMWLQITRPPRQQIDGPAEATSPAKASVPVLATIGVLTGFYSGLFGLGGGFVLVPLLTRWARFPIKRAIGTSLVAVTLLAVPGTITHAVLGNIDWKIALGLIVGVVPGAMLGARLSASAQDRTVRIAFTVLLIVTAVLLGLNELVWTA